MDLEQALAMVRAAGYKVSLPRASKKKLARIGPTCVVKFANGQVCRMTTHCDDVKPDFARGEKLCRFALGSRLIAFYQRKRGSRVEYPRRHSIRLSERWRNRLERYARCAKIASIHFERDGEILA